MSLCCDLDLEDSKAIFLRDTPAYDDASPYRRLDRSEDVETNINWTKPHLIHGSATHFCYLNGGSQPCFGHCKRISNGWHGTARATYERPPSTQMKFSTTHRKCLINEEVKMTCYLTCTRDLILYSNGWLLWKKVKITTKTLKTEKQF